MKKYSLILLLAAQGIFAQVIVTAKANKKALMYNESVTVDFTANINEGNFSEPSFEGFTIISGPKKMAEQTYINGQKSFLKTTTYVLSPVGMGVHIIQPLEYYTDDDQVYATKPIEIFVSEVTKGKKDLLYETAKKQLFLVPEISRSSVPIGEEVTVTYRLYIGEGIGLETVRIITNLDYKNLDTEDETGDIKSKKPGKTIYNGYVCKLIDVKKLKLHPKVAGEIEIEPLTLEATVDIPTATNTSTIIKRKILVTSTHMTIDVRAAE